MRTMHEFTSLFKALGDPLRLRILNLLPTEQVCEDVCNVSELSEELGVSQPTVSHHLKILKDGVWNIDNREHFDAATAPGGMVEGIRTAIDEGLVGHAGFTTHDTPENIISYVEEADWAEIILFTYNLLNTSYAPAIAAAHEKGIGTIIMNPVGGGKLGKPSEVFLRLARELGAEKVAELAMCYVLSNANVTTIISGIGQKRDVDEAVADAAALTPGQMTRIAEFLAEIAKGKEGFCTGCKYCMPCPHEINIPAVLNAIYDHRFLGFTEDAAHSYRNIKEAKADACAQCGECEAKCTQKLKIMGEMDYAALLLLANGPSLSISSSACGRISMFSPTSSSLMLILRETPGSCIVTP
jgi:predicted aldo/keto reductase-like oxidoreductase